MKKKKNIIIVSTILAMFALCTIFGSAVGNPYDIMNLHPDKSSIFLNSALTSNQKTFCGTVFSSSTRDVYFITKSKSATTNYKKDTEILVRHQSDRDVHLSETRTQPYSSNQYWRMELNNYGVGTKGGFAQMYMW